MLDWTVARHRAENSKVTIAGWVVIATFVLALAIATTWLIAARHHSQEPSSTTASSEQCTSTVDLQVYAIPENSAGALLDEFNASQPRAGESCIQALSTGDLNAAAILIAPDSPATSSLLEEAKRQVVHPSGGVPAVATALVVQGTDTQHLSYPFADQPDAAVLAASAKEHSPAAVLRRDAHLATSDAASKGLSYVVPASVVKQGEPSHEAGLPVLISQAHALASNDAGAARAAEVFMVFAANRTQLTELQEKQKTNGTTATSELYTLAALPEALDTLFLLDTSAQMSDADFARAKQWVLDQAAAVHTSGHQVALWNYSSPINPGVTKPWRANADFGSADLRPLLDGFGIAGVPQTRMSVLAALDAAQQNPAPSRVVVVTTGTQQDMNDADFAQRLGRALSVKPTVLEVVHVGGGDVDSLLQSQAADFTKI